MEEYQTLTQQANYAFNTADHLTYVTYNVVNDIKLIVVITQNLHNALMKTIDAILSYERYYKRISPYPNSFEAKFEILRRVAEKFNITKEELLLIRDIKELIDYRNKSPIEFARKDKFVMCSSTYKLKTLNLNKVKQYVQKTKHLIQKLNHINHDR